MQLVGVQDQVDRGDQPVGERETHPLVGAILATGGMLLLVYTLIKASSIGGGNTRRIGELAVAVGLLVAFVFNELRQRNPLAPLSTFRINGLGFSNVRS